ncbi:DUF2059 domain-containing protein [Brevundimonas viscosa]|uniref:DUF2059 domain-containing protein n=1 Tax=Brevundimonas viscosa TaxID=871741 RepID=A0A1I6SSZ8_9CAUL|nr:DUF2059 domain-containing protein [Brevundimonas viscosa]SFS80052.1 hypothetical protein SAMN05192570_2643 [Brevundimonas viscosa]
MRASVIIAAIWLALAAPAAAQSTGTPDGGRERHLALAGQYLELTQGGELFKQLREQIEADYVGSGLPAEQQTWVADEVTNMVREVMNDTIRELRDDVADSFTVAELQAAIDFYTSPLGRSLVRKQVELNFEMQRVMTPMLMPRMVGLMEKFCQRFDCEALAEAEAKASR